MCTSQPLCLDLGGIQPGPLTKYVSDALEEAEKADGLLQRFQVMVYPDMKGFDPTDIKPNAKARNRAYEVFEKLAPLKAEEFGATADHEDEVPCVRFSEDAQKYLMCGVPRSPDTGAASIRQRSRVTC